MRVRPLHDWVVIKIVESKEKSAGGIIIPDAAKEKPSEGIVDVVGPGRYKTEHGKEKKKKFVPTVLKPGQRVMFTRHMAQEVEIAGEVITLVREDDILGVFQEGTEQIALKEPHPVEVKKGKPLTLSDKTEGKLMTVIAPPEKKVTKAKAVPKTAKPSSRIKSEAKKTTARKKQKAAKKATKKNVLKKDVKKKK